MYGSETMLWKEKRDVGLGLYKWVTSDFLSIRRMDRFLNAWIRELCRMMKGIYERIDDYILWSFGHVESDRIAKRVYVGECAGNCSF